MRTNLLRFWAMLLVVGCAADVDTPEPNLLENSSGKDDSASLRFRLSEASSLVGMGIRCDAVEGCTGWLEVALRTPDACTILDDPRCGIGTLDMASVPLANVKITSATEGERNLLLAVETQDGSFISDSLSVEFSVLPGEEIDIELEHVAGAPDVTLNVRAEWQDRVDMSAFELEEYLGSQFGVSFQEVPTGYAGVRAYEIMYTQPIDHNDPLAFEEGRTFEQRAVLHHRSTDAPMVLLTSGYAYFGDFQSELTELLVANQLDTEQRFFGVSIPEGVTPDQWETVTIEQAAADHHRFVELLQPFYSGAWVSTGHSKGGMTSVFHRRFYPADVDLTVAYVAPISFEPADPRYVPFLDSIGTDECREVIRDLQRAVLERTDDLVAGGGIFEGITYEISGGLRNAIEDSVEAFEWSFWQGSGIQTCDQFEGSADLVRMEPNETLWDAISHIAFPTDDASYRQGANAYNFQAARELGYQSFATDHLMDLMSPGLPWVTPEGTQPMHDANAMADIQEWVLTTEAPLIFLYGEYDPWTGGAFDVNEDTLKVIAPQATHGAQISSLTAEDQVEVLDRIESALGGGAVPENPSLTPSRAPHPPFLDRL